ncbi:MAG: hypothetical protein IKR04_04790 [Clostridia bacterium]|nr:hypothetical protein [Clostridia bacterium]
MPVIGIASCAALPSKVTAVVESNLVFKLRAVANFVAVAAFPFKTPVNVVAYTLFHLFALVPNVPLLFVIG